MVKNLKQHEDNFVHLPKSYFWLIVGVIGIVSFGFISVTIWNSDLTSISSEITKQFSSSNTTDYIKICAIVILGIVTEAIVAICTNRKNMFVDGLLFGLLIGVLVGLLVGLFYGLLLGLLFGLLIGVLVGLLFGLLIGLLGGLLDGEDD